MEIVFKIVGSLCTTAYILGLLCNIVNFNYTQKAIRLTFALFLITNVFTPLNKFDFNISELNIPIEEYNAESYVLENAAAIIEEKIYAQLDSKDIDYSDIDVHINKEIDKVYVEYIKIAGVSVDNYHYIENILKNEGKVIFED